MVWAAAIPAAASLVGGILGSSSASRAAETQAAYQYQMGVNQLEVQNNQITQAWREWQEQQRWNQMQWENQLSEQQFQRGVYDQNLAVQQQQLANQYMLQDYMMGRQSYYDTQAQRNQDLQLQLMRENQNISQSERERALLELYNSQQIAQREYQDSYQRQQEADALAMQERMYGIQQYDWAKNLAQMEADYDRQNYERNYNNQQEDVAYNRDQLFQAQQQMLAERQDEIRRQQEVLTQLSSERDFDIEQLRQNQMLALEERAIDQELRNLYLSQAQYGTEKVQSLIEGMGTPAERKRYGDGDVAIRQGLLSDKYTQLADRAVERVSSTNEANLIRQGMDASTAGNIARGAVAEQAASTYIDAETRAYNEALAQIQGLNALNMDAEGADFARRNNLVNEAMNAYLTPLQYLNNAPQVRSGIYNQQVGSAAQYFGAAPTAAMYQPTGSSVYDRQVQSAYARAPIPINSGMSNYQTVSANQYQAPIRIGSGVMSGNIPSAVSQQLGIPSIGVNQVGYSPYGMTAPQVGGYSNAYNGMSGVYGNIADRFGSQIHSYNEAALNSGISAGNALADLGTTFGAWLDQRGTTPPPSTGFGGYGSGGSYQNLTGDSVYQIPAWMKQ